MFLSQRPNNDPQPMIDRFSGFRYPLADESLGYAHHPRPEFTQTRDPLPVKNLLTPDRYPDMDNALHFAGRDASLVAFSPRHEEFDTPVNAILAEFRHNLTVSPSLGLGLAEGYLRWSEAGSGEPTWTAEERDHARRVLSKLVAVYS